MAEAPDPFKARRQAALAGTQVGQTYTYRRTFTDGDVALFCGVTGDLNPFHQDELFSRESPFGRRIVPGLLPGSMLTHIGGMLGFLAAEMHFEFLAPVFIGDTVTCVVHVLERDEARKRLHCEAQLTNEAGQLVMRARFSGFPTAPRLAPDAAPLSDGP
ncbi:Acyl dehydratase [Deinococcus reticulitermitis]|uniref:Acyl dehydratase n=1 Tax=Deinococcus reticulitermitis TaxID=856736 RepID=A0A1H6ZHU9_9DEIO|nr:MaoC family dehydratase [Deinococcus reticulitermitis]SEJ51087.1 Acyl dehydratase [Deinococcus reticulitermitis]